MMSMQSSSRRQGFSLIELMVGLAIGLLCVLVVSNIMVVAEGQRRGTVSGSESQVSGALAMYEVIREVKNAGYGFSLEQTANGCNLAAFRGGVSAVAANNPGQLPDRLVPLRVTQGPVNGSDQIRLISSSKQIDPAQLNSVSFSQPLRFSSTFSRSDAALAVHNNAGIDNGDMLVLVAGNKGVPNNCYVMQVSANPADTISVPLAVGGTWNSVGHPDVTLPVTGFVVNLGQFVDRIIRVDAQSRLVVDELDATTMTRTTRVLQDNVVMFKVMYGRDTNANGDVDVYDYQTPVNQAGWIDVLNVRMAVLTRSTQFERDEVTTAIPQWRVGQAVPVQGAATCDDSACVPLDVSGLPDWKHYRYRVFDSVVASPNLRWRGDQ